MEYMAKLVYAWLYALMLLLRIATIDHESLARDDWSFQ